MEQLIDITIVSKLLSVSISQLRRWDKSGYLPAIHTPGGWRKYKASTIEAFQGNISKANRHGRHFKCKHCGRVSHADVVGGVNQLSRAGDELLASYDDLSSMKIYLRE